MRRTPIPPGKVGLFMLAAAAIPLVAKEAKPIANKIAKGIIRLGEKLKEATDQGQKPAEKPQEQERPKARKPRAAATVKKTPPVRKRRTAKK